MWWWVEVVVVWKSHVCTNASKKEGINQPKSHHFGTIPTFHLRLLLFFKVCSLEDDAMRTNARLLLFLHWPKILGKGKYHIPWVSDSSNQLHPTAWFLSRRGFGPKKLASKIYLWLQPEKSPQNEQENHLPNSTCVSLWGDLAPQHPVLRPLAWKKRPTKLSESLAIEARPYNAAFKELAKF